MKLRGGGRCGCNLGIGECRGYGKKARGRGVRTGGGVGLNLIQKDQATQQKDQIDFRKFWTPKKHAVKHIHLMF